MTHRLLIAAGIHTIFLAVATSQATAYDFDESCAPTTLHETVQNNPSALLMLDNSCSMDGNSGNGQTKMQVSRQVITELTNAVAKAGPCDASNRSGCDDVLLGVGWFSVEAGVDVPPGDDTATSIQNAVNNYPFKCQTQHGAAARAIYNSAELANSDRVGVGVVITDGAPYQKSPYGSTKDTVEETLYFTCEARKRATPTLTFFVGFGAGTNQQMNNIFAAAGGTGQCCLGSNGTPCSYQPSELVDPCSLPKRFDERLNADALLAAADNGQLKCKGAKQANNGQDLKDGLLAILGEVACTFPLDIPSDYLTAPGADEDQEATRVEFDHDVLGNNIRVQPLDPGNPNKFYDYLVNQRGIAPAVAADYIGEGWSFADPFRRTVTLTTKLCEEVRSDNVQITETQAACLCENTGLDCNVPCVDNDSDGFDDNTGSACETDQNSDLVMTGRCQPGIVDCQVGVEVCVPRFGPQPDICNGVDDDCDGFIDNSSRAKPDLSGAAPHKWNGNQSQLDGFDFDTGLFCSFEDFACSCGTNPPHTLDHDPVPMSAEPDHEWMQLLRSTDTQRDLCSCNAALELDDAQPAQAGQDESTDMSEPQAACQQAPGQAPSLPTSLLLFLGSFAFWRRRQRRH